MADPLIIIGAGLAGWTTAREFRKRDSSTPVLLVTADNGDFYAKPSLSNAFAQGRGPAQLVSTAAAAMAKAQNLQLLSSTQVSAIDPVARSIATAQGPLAYNRLVLAAGAQPIRVPLAGDAANAVLSVNSLDDFAAFHAHLTSSSPVGGSSQPRRILIMGAGLIGCEFANDLVASGYEVTVVDPAARPLAALLPEAVSLQLAQALQALGVRWHFGCSVRSVDHAAAAGDAALRVELSDGTVLQMDAVLSAIGLRADTRLAQSAGLACNRGVLVDASLQTSNADIYALGDCAQYAGGAWNDANAAPGGGPTLPFVMPIMHAARALAATLAGTPTPLAFPVMPVAIKTPALPIVVAPPAIGVAGAWLSSEAGVWQFRDAQGRSRGFCLSGTQTSRRTEQAGLMLI